MARIKQTNRFRNRKNPKTTDGQMTVKEQISFEGSSQEKRTTETTSLPTPIFSSFCDDKETLAIFQSRQNQFDGKTLFLVNC